MQAPERSLVRHTPRPPPPLHLAKDECLHREWHDQAPSRWVLLNCHELQISRTSAQLAGSAIASPARLSLGGFRCRKMVQRFVFGGQKFHQPAALLIILSCRHEPLEFA